MAVGFFLTEPEPGPGLSLEVGQEKHHLIDVGPGGVGRIPVPGPSGCALQLVGAGHVCEPQAMWASQGGPLCLLCSREWVSCGVGQECWILGGADPRALLVIPRHLPMIAALLHGRTHLNFQEFRQQNHLTFFLHVLGVLELLQPQVFQNEHQGALWDCLRSFVRLLLVRGPLPFRQPTLGGGAPPGPVCPCHSSAHCALL